MPRLSWRFALVLLVLAFATEASAQQTVRWQSDLEGAKREAFRTNRLVLIHYWATWCPACYRMENEVFVQPAVAAAVHERFVPVKLNFDHYQADARAMGVTILPTAIVISPDGQVVEKLPGFVQPDEYVALLAQVGGNPQASPGHGFHGTTAGQPYINGQPLAAAQTQPAADYLGKRYANYRSENRASAQTVQPAPQYAAPQYAAPQYPNQQYAAQQPVVQPPVAQGALAQGANQTLGPRWGYPRNQPQVQAATNPALGGRALPGQYSSTPLQASQTQAAPPQTQPAGGPAIRPAIGPAVRPPLAKAATGPAPPKFGLDGFCPVSLVENKAWKFGDRRWGATHLGVTYLFTGLKQQQKFLKTPDRYSPVGLGNDIVVLLESGQTVAGQRKHGVSFGGRIYLFSSQKSLDAFTRQPRQYIENFSRLMQANRPQYGQNVR